MRTRLIITMALMAAMTTSAMVCGAETGQPSASAGGLGFEFIKNAKFGVFSLRYGVRVSGYWIDRHTPKRFSNAKRMAVALRAGNPDAVTWQSGRDYVQDGLSLEDAWPAAEGGDTTHGEKDQCCICPIDNAWFQGDKVRVPAAEVFRGVVRCAGRPDQKGGIHIELPIPADVNWDPVDTVIVLEVHGKL